MLEELSYREIQKEATKHGIRSVGVSRLDLLRLIKEKLEPEPEPEPEPEEYEPEEPEESEPEPEGIEKYIEKDFNKISSEQCRFYINVATDEVGYDRHKIRKLFEDSNFILNDSFDIILDSVFRQHNTEVLFARKVKFN
jgi:hypothetical protein